MRHHTFASQGHAPPGTCGCSTLKMDNMTTVNTMRKFSQDMCLANTLMQLHAVTFG